MIALAVFATYILGALIFMRVGLYLSGEQLVEKIEEWKTIPPKKRSELFPVWVVRDNTTPSTLGWKFGNTFFWYSSDQENTTVPEKIIDKNTEAYKESVHIKLTILSVIWFFVLTFMAVRWIALGNSFEKGMTKRQAELQQIERMKEAIKNVEAEHHKIMLEEGWIKP